jgi:hypothetical protein
MWEPGATNADRGGAVRGRAGVRCVRGGRVGGMLVVAASFMLASVQIAAGQ